MVNDIKKIVLAVVMALITAISAQLSFKIGPVPYTMQNFGVMLSGFLLGPYYGFVSMVIYLLLIALALPVAAGGGGLGVLLGPTAGFLYGFAISSFIAGIFRRLIWKNGEKREVFLLWISTLIASAPVYILGFLVFYNFAVNNQPLLSWSENATRTFGLNFASPAMVIFAATVLIFIPQDFFVDHLLAVLVYRYVYRMLKERGMEVD
uniref:Biotin transporter BioY n=1 Tax=Archaeoglobus fulgidus TaxID=2234 RepID=A0A7C3MA54_ARCFL